MWFTADLLFESVHNGQPREDDVWEQQIILIWAACEEEARRRAQEIGKTKEVEYVSATGDRVRWVFRHVESIFELFDTVLGSGTEVFARFLRAGDAEALLRPFEDKGPDEFRGIPGTP